MDPRSLRNYGVAFSDAEASWPAAVKKQMKSRGMAVVLESLGLWDRLRFGWGFLSEKRRMRSLDLAPIRARGMANERFLAQQLEYLAMFSALVRVVGPDRALEIALRLMDATAREPLLLCLPEPEQLRAFPDHFEALREYFRVGPEACRRAGCNEMSFAVDQPDRFEFHIGWCVWLELATLAGVPEACLPNCYADDIAFPEYFAALGVTYSRSSTLARGAERCDFCFQRASSERSGHSMKSGL